MRKKKQLSTKEAIELRTNRKLLFQKLESYKHDFDYAQRKGLAHHSLIHLYYSEMQLLADACREYERKCKILPAQSDICKVRLYEFNAICEQDIKRRDQALKAKGHASSYLSWSSLMLDLSLEIVAKSLLEQEKPKQVTIF